MLVEFVLDAFIHPIIKLSVVVVLERLPLCFSDFGQLLLLLTVRLFQLVKVSGGGFFSELVCSEFVDDWNS